MPQGVEFEEQKYVPNRNLPQKGNSSTVVKFLIDNRIAKDEKAAFVIVVVTLVLICAATIFLFVYSATPEKGVSRDVADKVMQNSIRESTR